VAPPRNYTCGGREFRGMLPRNSGRNAGAARWSLRDIGVILLRAAVVSGSWRGSRPLPATSVATGRGADRISWRRHEITFRPAKFRGEAATKFRVRLRFSIRICRSLTDIRPYWAASLRRRRTRSIRASRRGISASSPWPISSSMALLDLWAARATACAGTR